MLSFARFFLSITAGLLWILPRRAQLLIGDTLAILVFDVFRFRRRLTLENLALAFPEKSLWEQTGIARGSYRNLGRGLVEYAFYPFLNQKNIGKNFEIQGLANYANQAAQDRGVLILTLHLGNGDLGIAALARSGFPIYLISKHFRSQWLNELWFGLRKKMGLRFIAEEKSSFQILRALKAKGMVVFVLDQFMGPPVGVKTTFFGRETGTAAGLALFSLKTQLPVLPGYTYRKPDGKLVLVFDAPIQPAPTEHLDEDIARLTQTYTNKIESLVRRYPDQWIWLHRRWKTFEVR